MRPPTGRRFADRSRWSSPRALFAVLVLAIALACSSCAGVPTRGPVTQVRPMDPAYPVPFIDVTAPPPRAGDSESDIAEGFLLAMSAYDAGYAVARMYLTPRAAAQWRPEYGIAIYGTVGTATQVVPPGRVHVELPLQARVGPDGEYQRAAGGERLSLDLRMERVDGEWRIATPPPGVIMTDFDFDREFQQFNRYFFDPAFEVLVPDEVWLPRSGRQATLLTSSLLAGPSTWLAPAVRTAAIAGTQLAIRSVPIEFGVARIDLSKEATAASPAQRDRLAAQLARTLGQLPEVRSVALTVLGSPLVLPGAQTGIRLAAADARFEPTGPQDDNRVYAVTDGRGVAVGVEPRRLPGPLGGDAELRSIAVSMDASRAAGVRADGRTLVLSQTRTSAAVRIVASGNDLQAPSFDRLGVVWTAEQGSSGGVVRAFGSDGRELEVGNADFAGERLRTVRLSSDGIRLALVSESGGVGRLQVAVVLRDKGRVELGGTRELRVGVADVRDVAWLAPDRLALLGSRVVGEPTQPFLSDLSGAQLDAQGPVTGALSLTAAQHQPLVVATDGGRLLRQDANLRWRDIARGAAPAYPG